MDYNKFINKVSETMISQSRRKKRSTAKNAQTCQRRGKRSNKVYMNRPTDDDGDCDEEVKCCEKPKREKCCVQCPRDITESRGFQNYLKCLMAKNCGMSKCDAIKQAKKAYRCFKEREKCKYRYMGCNCPDECDKCDKPNCGGVIECATKGKDKKKKCVKCPCDAPRPCPCKFKPPNPCARGRNCDAALADEYDAPDARDARDAPKAEALWPSPSTHKEVQEVMCSPIFCQDCGGAFLSDAHDGLGCGFAETFPNVSYGLQQDFGDRSLGFRNFFRMFQIRYPCYPKSEAMNMAAARYDNLKEMEKANFRDMGHNPLICHKPILTL